MAGISIEIREQHERIKKNISAAYQYFEHNFRRFNFYRKYVFDTSISDEQRNMLITLKKPIIEANIIEAYLSRLLGEFSKHEPSIEVSPAEGVPISHEVIDVVEGHIRHIIYEANKNSMCNEVYKDSLSGGFSVMKALTDYASPMSMKQIIKVSRVFDPCMCVFDPMARASHKGDGKFSGELFPMLHDDFIQEYPNASKNISYMRTMGEFNWSYRNEQQADIVLVADYYEKKLKRTQIAELANGKVITMRNYKKLQEYWEDQQIIEQIPIIVGKPRWTELETVCRYKLNELEIIDYEETDYKYLPHIFVDGNSIMLSEGGVSSSTYQMTRPQIYHAKGTQDLKNFSMQCLGNYLENMVQHKFIVMKEALPSEDDYADALSNMQEANTIVVNAFSENDPSLAIPTPIREVQNTPAPPEIMAAFQAADATMQTILGSYASNLGKNDNDLSGKAVIESASVGNSAAMPYVTGYLAGLTQLGNIIVDLMPKYMRGKREIPVISMNGAPGYKSVNQEGHPYLDYEESAIHVQIEAGVNFQVQKNQALQQMSVLMGVSEEFNHFMNSPRGLPILVKNLTVYGADELQEAVPQYLQEQQQQQQQAQQQQQELMQNDPRMLRAQVDMQKAQLLAQEQQMKAQQQEIDNQLAIAKQATEDKVADAKILEAESKVSQAQIESAIKLESSNTALEAHALDAAAKLAEVQDREHGHRIKEDEIRLKEHDAGLKAKKLDHDISMAKYEKHAYEKHTKEKMPWGKGVKIIKDRNK